jgi:hypothetical protein
MSSYNEAALDAHQADEDEAEAVQTAMEAAEKAAHKELTAEYLDALNDPTGKARVTVVFGEHRDDPFREEQTVCAATFDLISIDGLHGRDLVFEPALMTLLAAGDANDALEKLKALKVTLAKAFADTYAVGLARVNVAAARRSA